MKAVDARSISMFFFFALLDEKAALRASTKAIKLCRSLKQKFSDLTPEIVTIKSIHQVWLEEAKTLQRGRQETAFSKEWIIPPEVEMRPWREFQKMAPNEELVSLILINILKFQLETVAEALSLSKGTIKSRQAAGQTRLGHYVHFDNKNTDKKPILGIVDKNV